MAPAALQEPHPTPAVEDSARVERVLSADRPGAGGEKQACEVLRQGFPGRAQHRIPVQQGEVVLDPPGPQPAADTGRVVWMAYTGAFRCGPQPAGGRGAEATREG